jgi:hypothetical protein
MGDCSVAGDDEVRVMQQNVYKWAARDSSQNYISLCQYMGASAKYGFDLAGLQEEWNMEGDCSNFPATKIGSDSLYQSTLSSVTCGISRRFKLNKKQGNDQERYLDAVVCSKGGKEFVFGTSHWCIDWKGNGECSGANAWNRDENAEESVKGLEEMSGGLRPIIFTCDCNTNWGSAVRVLQNSGFEAVAHTGNHWGFDYIWYKNPSGARTTLQPSGDAVQTQKTQREHSGPGAYDYHGSDHPGLFMGFVLQSNGLASTTPVCSSEDKDRYSPNLGGCCDGLEECIEPRPTSSNAYCGVSDANHGTSCWSTIVMCRDACQQQLPQHEFDLPDAAAEDIPDGLADTIADPTAPPTTANPTTASPTTPNPTTAPPTTVNPTTADPTTASPTTANPTTASPTTSIADEASGSGDGGADVDEAGIAGPLGPSIDKKLQAMEHRVNSKLQNISDRVDNISDKIDAMG